MYLSNAMKKKLNSRQLLENFLHSNQFHTEMTQEPSVDIANTYKELNEAEKQASKLELMLDSFEAKLDSILHDAENITTTKDNETSTTTGDVSANQESQEKKSTSQGVQLTETEN